MVKIFGSYQVAEGLLIGANLQWQSGRPINAFGYHPTDEFAREYGSESFYAQGELVPRGSMGTTPSNWSLDLTASYSMDLGEDYDLTLRADVFNVFNNDTVTEVYEIYDDESSDHALGVMPTMDSFYGQPTNWQTPRYFRFSASLRY
jgi:hypothetical protein